MIAYTEDYKILCKHAWYNAGRPKSAKTWIEATPEDEHGRKPSTIILRNWMREHAWHFWADGLDAKAMLKVEEGIVVRRARMFEKHAQKSAEMLEKAWNHLQEVGFDSSASAVQAFFKAMETERTSLGVSKLMIQMAEMDTEQLNQEFIRLVVRGNENNQLGEIIDVDEIPEKKEEVTEQIDADS
jgi:hypothetical protein